MDRFERLAAGEAGGTKLSTRMAVNPGLSRADALDEARFLRALRARLGEPDHIGDESFSYSIRDRETGVEFEAYSAQSGPSYGGSVRYIADRKGRRLHDEARASLAAFDAWLEAAIAPG